MRRIRGQSDTVGVVLLTAVVVVLSVTVGVFLLENSGQSAGTEPTVDISSDVDGQTVVIEHRGGDSYETADIRVQVRQQSGDDYQYALNEFSLTSGGEVDTFASGDRWEKSITGLNGEFQLFIIDERNSEIIHDETHVAE